MTADQLRQALIANPSLYRRTLSYNSNSNFLRSTKSYWYTRSQELQDMVKQLGAPTLFFTLSPADFHWPELYRLLYSFLGIHSDPEAPIEDEFRENRRRKKLLNENPLIVAWFFQQRAESFIGDVLFGKFPVVNHWWRIEFQHRGSPHVHGFVWLQNAPISLDSVVGYISKYASKSEVASDNLYDIQNFLNSVRTENQTAKSIIQKILINQFGERDYSAQECIWVSLAFSFYSSSRKFFIFFFFM